MGNIIGSTISNILGAFSLGLLFHSQDRIAFDQSSKMYCIILLVLTLLIAGLLGFAHHLVWKAVGGVLIAVFAVYIAVIAWTIAKGIFDAPELSDSDSESDSDGDEEQEGWGAVEGGSRDHAAGSDAPAASGPAVGQASETDALLPSSRAAPTRRPGPRHGLLYHVALLVVGFIAVLLSAYVLSTAATNLVDEFGISDVLFGIVVLSIATTLPEKFIAVMSSSKGHDGIMVANTVGSNIFLLTLCIGVLWLSTGGEYDEGSTNGVEIAVMGGSTAAMALTVWLEPRWTRWIGATMLLAYFAFLVLEFTIIRKI